jgi:O-antigen/teichoic acid export membrane protein
MQRWRLPAGFAGVSRIVGGSVVGQGLVVLTAPVLTRLYDPTEFGLFTVFTSVVGIVSLISTASLHRAIPVPRSEGEAADVAWAALAAVTATAVLTGAVGVVAAEPIANLLGVPLLEHYWWLVALTVFVLGTYFTLSEFMTRARSYGALGARNLLQGVGQAATQVGLGMVHVGPLGLLLGPGVGRMFGLGGLVSNGGLLRQPRPTLARLRDVVRRYRRFPLLTTPSALLNSAGLEVPMLLVSALYGDARAGLLGLTIRVISTPANVIGQAVGQVFTGESSEAIREPTGALDQMLRSTVRRLLLVGALPAAVLILAGPWLFGVIFGPTWTEAGEYARVLALAYLAQFAVNPVSMTPLFLGRQDKLLAWAGTRLVLTSAGPLTCGLLGAPVLVAIAALSIGHIVGWILMYRLCVQSARAADDEYRRRRA